MSHIGSLLAVICVLLARRGEACGRRAAVAAGRFTNEGRIALLIVLGTIPAVAFGLLLKRTASKPRFRGP